MLARPLASVLVLLLTALSTSALPLRNSAAPVEFIDAWPEILRPKSGEVYTAGDKITIKWDQSLNSSSVGQSAHEFLLFYTIGNDTQFHGNTVLATDIALYANFSSIEVSLPNDLETHDSYRVALVGSTSDQSGAFTINAK